jgi:hypothetical protein
VAEREGGGVALCAEESVGAACVGVGVGEMERLGLPVGLGAAVPLAVALAPAQCVGLGELVCGAVALEEGVAGGVSLLVEVPMLLLFPLTPPPALREVQVEGLGLLLGEAVSEPLPALPLGVALVLAAAEAEALAPPLPVGAAEPLPPPPPPPLLLLAPVLLLGSPLPLLLLLPLREALAQPEKPALAVLLMQGLGVVSAGSEGDTGAVAVPAWAGGSVGVGGREGLAVSLGLAVPAPHPSTPPP